MDENTLIKFIERLIHNCAGDKKKISYQLAQLQNILILQGGDMHLVQIVSDSINGSPELAELSNKKNITKEDLEIEIKRSKMRIKREEEARNRSRC